MGMMSAKRHPNADFDEVHDRPSKVAKAERPILSIDDLSAARARIVDLENQVKELQDFIDSSGLARSKFKKTPASHGQRIRLTSRRDPSIHSVSFRSSSGRCE